MVFEVKPNFSENAIKEDYAEFVIEPLPQGFGHTLGTSLRRVLLTSLEGASITSIKIDGAKHEFTTIPGVKEDMVDLVLNIKKIRVSLEGKDEATMTVNKKGPGEVKAADIEVPAGLKILNPDQYITTLADKKTSLKIDFVVKKGKSYLPAEEQNVDELGVIPVDGIFSPVLDVNYQVSDTRVGGETNFDKLTLQVTTNGGITPIDALKKSAEILKEYFSFIIEPEIVEKMSFGTKEEVSSKADEGDVLIEELDLPMRVVNSLTAAGIKNLNDLTKKTEKEVSKIKNLGAKSIKEIKAKMEEMHLSFAPEEK